MRQKSVTGSSPSECLVKTIRRATRKQYSAEEQIRIVLDGLRHESSIAELCRREGIAEGRVNGPSGPVEMCLGLLPAIRRGQVQPDVAPLRIRDSSRAASCRLRAICESEAAKERAICSARSSDTMTQRR